MLGPGDNVPDVQVWTAPRDGFRSLKQVLGAGYTLFCFYLGDWSQSTCYSMSCESKGNRNRAGLPHQRRRDRLS